MINLVCVDRKSDEFSELTVYDNFYVFVYTMFKMPLFAPPANSINIKVWIFLVLDIISQFLDIRLASRTVIAKAVLLLIDRMNSSQTGVYPTISEVINELWRSVNQKNRKHFEYVQTAVNRLESLKLCLGEMLDCRQGFIIERLTKINFCLDLSGLPLDMQNIAINLLIAKFFHFYVILGQTSSVRTLFIFDEGQSLFRRNYELQDASFFLSDVISMGRSYGINLWVNCQYLGSDISESLIANTGRKIQIGRLGIGTEYDRYYSALGCDQKQIEYLKNQEL